MKIKVCGLKYPDNIVAVLECQPDFIGFIFYENSKRLVNQATFEYLEQNELTTQRVGVFVNHPLDDLLNITEQCGFDYLQLHGKESTDYCNSLMQKGFKLIKAFQINDEFDWNSITEYEALCSYFLFDTASKGYGGSGKQFNWKILENYKGSTPFFLSGGIGIDDVDDILKLDHEKLFAVDLNSRFESEPGRKRIDLLDPFIKKLKS